MQYKKLYQLAGYILSVVFIYLLVQKSGQIDVQKIRIFLKLQDILLLIGLLFLGYALRVLRWKILLGSVGIKIPFSTLYVNYIISVGINNVLPFRAGDAYRIVGIRGGATKTQLFGSVFVERIMDVITLLLMFAIWFSIEKIQWENNTLISFIIIVTIITVAIISTFYLVKKYANKPLNVDKNSRWKQSLEVFLHNLAIQLKLFFSIRIVLRTMPLTMLGWLPEVLIFLYVAHGLGIDCSFSMAALTHAFATLSTMAPSSPGFFGTYHYAAYYILTAYGIDQGLVLFFAVITHCILWLPPIVITVLLAVRKLYRHKDRLIGD